MREAVGTHHTGLKFWWLAIEDVRRLDPIFDNSDSAVEKSHQMTGISTLILEVGATETERVRKG